MGAPPHETTTVAAVRAQMSAHSTCAADVLALEDTHCDPGCQGGTKLLALHQVSGGYVLRTQDLFGCLRMRAYDQRIGDRPQAPARRDPLNLPRGVAPVATGANENREGFAVEPIERRVVSTIEKILHLSRHGRKIFRRSE
jgi:hypothetical protein